MGCSVLKENRIFFFFFFFLAFLLVNIAASSVTAKIHIRNNCEIKVWLAIIAEAGNGEPSSSGFELETAGDSRVVLIPALWSGSVWARTGCTEEDHPSINGTLFRCITGDCSSTTINCSTAAGGKVTSEVTVVRLKLKKNGITNYNVTLGNIPMSVGVLMINEDDMSTPSTTFDISLCSSPPPPISDVTQKHGHKSWGKRLHKIFLGRRLPFTVGGVVIFVLVVMAILCRRRPNNSTTIGHAQNVQVITNNNTSLTL